MLGVLPIPLSPISIPQRIGYICLSSTYKQTLLPSKPAILTKLDVAIYCIGLFVLN